MESVEAIRARYRPECLTTLFVGESAPASGAFFYLGNTSLARHMRTAMEAAGLSAGDDFLADFKGLGWYLDDLVLTPVNDLSRSEREAKCWAARQSLAERIADCRPRAIVSLLISIKNIVDAAAVEARSNAPRYAVPFPGNGQQSRFRREIALILPKLARREV